MTKYIAILVEKGGSFAAFFCSGGVMQIPVVRLPVLEESGVADTTMPRRGGP